jgi:MoxR-like ATPase
MSIVERITKNITKYIIGHRELIKLMNIAILSGGHILLEGPPGTGKTTIANFFAQSIGGTFRRVQMVPDLLPSDIIGTIYFDMSISKWRLKKGPIFSNVLLIDEINRAPPRTQAAFLEAMQEHRVTIENETLNLPIPFLVLATQLSQTQFGTEGTYQLTPVQIDRFAYSYPIDFPSEEEEIEIISKIDNIEIAKIDPVVSPEEIYNEQKRITNIYVSKEIKEYIVNIVNFIRKQKEILLPPSPRASIWLFKGSRVLAYMEGKDYVIPDYVKYLAKYVLLHRIRIKPEYEIEGIKAIDIINRALEYVEVPKAFVLSKNSSKTKIGI